MRNYFIILGFTAAVWLTPGCKAPDRPDAVVEPEDAMLQLGAGIQPEELLFPEYLLMSGFELDQHGRIFGSSVIGADLKTDQNLSLVRQQVEEVLAARGWLTMEMASGGQFFLLRGSAGEQLLEIRAVQGTGATSVFILYQPGPGPLL